MTHAQKWLTANLQQYCPSLFCVPMISWCADDELQDNHKVRRGVTKLAKLCERRENISYKKIVEELQERDVHRINDQNTRDHLWFCLRHLRVSNTNWFSSGGAENAGHENAGPEIDGPMCRAWNCRTWKCRTWNCRTWKCRTWKGKAEN